MKQKTKITVLKRALALAAILALSGSVWAKKPSSGPGVPGDLSDDRTTATVTITEQCNAATVAYTETVSVYIFQSVGRLINIGTYNGTVACGVSTTPISQDVAVIVKAVEGLSFQPGPATMLIRFTRIDPVTLVSTVTETGSRIDLRP